MSALIGQEAYDEASRIYARGRASVLSSPEFYVADKSTPFGAALALVADELSKALARFASFNSAHEGKAVIEEELDELWEHVKANTGVTDEARTEAIQVAAMALRYVIDLCDPLAAA